VPVTDLIALVGLEHKHCARVKTLSGGQRRRLDLALALVGNPDLVFLDEPTTGFDPAARRGAWRLVENLRGLGRTIVLTSHYMDEVQHLADRAVVITNGRIVAEGATDSLGRSGPSQTVISFRLPTQCRSRGATGTSLLLANCAHVAERDRAADTAASSDDVNARELANQQAPPSPSQSLARSPSRRDSANVRQGRGRLRFAREASVRTVRPTRPPQAPAGTVQCAPSERLTGLAVTRLRARCIG
jgi:ABC-type multidrug transport system ATPase subunit